MSISVRIAMFVFVGLLFIAPAQAAQLFPLQTRQWMEIDKQDQAGHKWTVRVDVLEEVTLNNKKYFHVLQQNYDPVEGDTFDDNLVRSTDTELFVYNKVTGGEMLVFQQGQVGTNWIYVQPDNTSVQKEIVAIESINIPYGGTYTAYKYRQHSISPPSPYHYEWVVPGLGWIAKEEDYWVSEGRATPINSVLARMDKTPAAWTGRYSFVDIDYPERTTTLTDIRGLNDLGQIVGSYTSGGRQYPFIYSGGTYNTLNIPGGISNTAWGINDSGQVGGLVVINTNPANQGYIYNTIDSSLTTIFVNGSYSTTVYGINGVGQVSGYYYTNTSHCYKYDPNTSSWTYFDKSGATATYAYGINNAGTVVGNYTMGGHDSGFTYDGSLHDLNVPGAQNTRTVGINDHGDIVGRYWNDGGAIQGFIYSNGVFKTPTMPGGKKIVRILGINNARQIVGLYTADGGANYHGFLGTPVPPRGLPSLLLLLQD